MFELSMLIITLMSSAFSSGLGYFIGSKNRFTYLPIKEDIFNDSESNMYHHVSENNKKALQDTMIQALTLKENIEIENKLGIAELTKDIYLSKMNNNDIEIQMSFEDRLLMAAIAHENGPVMKFKAHTNSVKGNEVSITITYSTPRERMRLTEYPINL